MISRVVNFCLDNLQCIRPSVIPTVRAPMAKGNWRQFFFFLSSGPNRGRSPVEWGDFPFVCSFVRSSVRPFVRPFVHLSVPPLGQPARPEAQPARPEAQPARPEAQPARSEAQPAKSEAQPVRSEAKPARSERTDERKIYPFYRTLSPIGASPQKKCFYFLFYGAESFSLVPERYCIR